LRISRTILHVYASAVSHFVRHVLRQLPGSSSCVRCRNRHDERSVVNLLATVVTTRMRLAHCLGMT
jgi:hypothetical protein